MMPAANTTPRTAGMPFHKKTPSTQAGMLCNDPAFLAWLALAYPTLWADCGSTTATATAAAVVRALCGVDSRRDLDADPGHTAWRSLLRTWVDHDMGRR